MLELRNKDGVYIADLRGYVADRFISECIKQGIGKMETIKIVGKGRFRVMRIVKESSYTIGGGLIELMLFEGSYAKILN